MRERGVRTAEAVDLYAFNGGPFDTILSLCNGLDKVGNLAELSRFLDRMGELLAPNGQLIADSFDLQINADAARLTELSRKEAAGRYFGEVDLQFEHKGYRGALFSALHIDFDALKSVAQSRDWRGELVSDAGHYLANLR